MKIQIRPNETIQLEILDANGTVIGDFKVNAWESSGGCGGYIMSYLMGKSGKLGTVWEKEVKI
jgi:hypothetical protein